MRLRTRPLRGLAAVLTLGLLLGACSSGDNDAVKTAGTDPFVTEGKTPRVFAQYDLGVLPMPNDVVWLLDEDGDNPAIQLPTDGPLGPLALAINARNLLGLSPNMFLSIPLTSENPDADQLTNGFAELATLQVLAFRLPTQDNPTPTPDVRLFPGPFPVTFEAEEALLPDADPFTPPSIVKLLPQRPFQPDAFYAVVVRVGLKDKAGFDVAPSFLMRALKSDEPFPASSPFSSLEDLRIAWNRPGGLFDGVALATSQVFGEPWLKEDILALWTFHTAGETLDVPPDEQTPPESLAYGSFDARLGQVYGLSAGWPVAFPGASHEVQVIGAGSFPTPGGMGTVYPGSFRSPYLRASDLSTSPLPAVTTANVPFLAVLPNSGEGPYPVTVFQHGLGVDKSVALAVADVLAARGVATIAIDAPLHGTREDPIDNPDEPFFSANLFLDRVNLYQAALDLWETVEVVQDGLDLNGDEVADLDGSRLRFASHSLGAIIGSVFLNGEAQPSRRPERILLSNPSALLANVLDASSLPELTSVVGSLGFTRGATDYFIFLNLVQWLLDPVDATYMGIGDNDPDILLSVFALDDPTVSSRSSKVFLSTLGLDPRVEVVSVDPDDVEPGVFPDTAALAYEYGVPGQLIHHSFLLTPDFDSTAPWYASYNPADQLAAWQGAQAQAGAFLAGP